MITVIACEPRHVRTSSTRLKHCATSIGVLRNLVYLVQRLSAFDMPTEVGNLYQQSRESGTCVVGFVVGTDSAQLATSVFRLWTVYYRTRGTNKTGSTVLNTQVLLPSYDNLMLHSALQRLVLNISLGYFAYDTLCCLYIDFDYANVLHHLCTMLGLAVGVCNGVVSTLHHFNSTL